MRDTIAPELIGQAEIAVHVRVEEAVDLHDPAGTQPQQVDRAQAEQLGTGLAEVAAKPSLPVGP